jgi:hypothetical protein
MHLRVETARGKPKRCGLCGTIDPDKRYHWANLTGNYADVNDYIRACVSCHFLMDNARRVASGHPTSPRRGGGAR